METSDIAKRAKQASRRLAEVDSGVKDLALLGMAEAIERQAEEILAENADDVSEGRDKGLSGALVDRLMLDGSRLKGIATSLRNIAALSDPVGEVLEGHRTPEGLFIEKVRVPFGVVLVVYEARPNVTVDAAALCVKTGNAVILRGGTDATRSNQVLASVIKGAAVDAGLPADSVQYLADSRREALVEMLQYKEQIDLVIPRGGESLKEFLLKHSKIPVIYAAGGNCHVYVDKSADLRQALAITVNAKCQRPGVCNAAETLLVHQAVAKRFLPAVAKALQEQEVKLYVDERGQQILEDKGIEADKATELHYATEFLGLEMAVRIVDSLDEALDHIALHGTGHSEAIVTNDLAACRHFTQAVDAAAVYINASTRFTDGGVFGMGAEIGISTQKLHARGPVALKELTSTKYVVSGDGHIR